MILAPFDAIICSIRLGMLVIVRFITSGSMNNSAREAPLILSAKQKPSIKPVAWLCLMDLSCTQKTLRLSKKDHLSSRNRGVLLVVASFFGHIN